MKFWVKITVATLAVILVAFAVWAFCFKEKDEVVAFNSVTEFVEYKASMGIASKLTDLNDMNYLGDDKTNIITTGTENKSDIIRIRKNTLSPDVIIGYDSNGDEIGKFNSYVVIDEYIDEIIKFYLPYLNSNHKNNKLKRQVTGAVSDYIDSLKTLDNQIDIVIAYQKSITGTDIEMTVLKGHYNSFSIKYKEALNKSSKLISAMVNYINECVYSGNFKADTRSALYDCYSRALLAMSNSEKIIEDYYLHDLYLVADKIDKLNSSKTIYGIDNSYSEYQFLSSYNKFVNDYNSSLTDIFAMKNYNKVQMADGRELSSVKEEVQNEIVVILNVLGF